MEGRIMGQVLHGCATTTEAIRRAIQHSQESLRALSRRYGINQKTVAKWKKSGFVADLPTGPSSDFQITNINAVRLSGPKERIPVEGQDHSPNGYLMLRKLKSLHS